MYNILITVHENQLHFIDMVFKNFFKNCITVIKFSLQYMKDYAISHKNIVLISQNSYTHLTVI